MSFLDVKFQPEAQRHVQRALRSGRTPHAYIFHGPEGVGKEMLALRLAQALLCADIQERSLPAAQSRDMGGERIRDACGNCPECKLMVSLAHPDLHIITRQLHRNHPDPAVRKRAGVELTIDVVRHFLLERAAMTAARGRGKVFIVCEAETMSPQAQNALLKTLEEPPKGTFLILLCASAEQLLATTLSRCQNVRFSPLPSQFVREQLNVARDALSNEEIEWIADYSNGSLGRAITLAEQQQFPIFQRIRAALQSFRQSKDDATVKLWTEEAKLMGEKLREVDPEMTDAESTRRGLKEIFALIAHAYRGRIGEAATTRQPGMFENCARSLEFIVAAERALDSNVNSQLVVESLVGELRMNPTAARV